MAFLPDLDALVQRYADAWNASDPDQRWQLVHGVTAPDVTFVDPRETAPVTGQAALTAFLGLLHEQLGQRFELDGPVDAHHGWLRVRWRLSGNGAASSGLLVGALNAERRLTHIVHFLDA